ncbi:MAG: hypothetical protein ACRYFR_05910 [Janthinobacterium lividum]
MKKLFSPFARLLAVAGCALALGSCNRAEYAMLPKTSTYYGEAAHHRTAPAPAATEQSAAVVAAPVAAQVPTAGAPAPVAAAASQAVAPQALATPAAAATAVVAAPKPTLVQRMMAKKVMKKLDKMVAKVQGNDATASTARIDGNLRTGILALLVALIAGILGGISGFVGTLFAIIAVIAAIIGIVFIVLWLLDNV